MQVFCSGCDGFQLGDSMIYYSNRSWSLQEDRAPSGYLGLR